VAIRFTLHHPTVKSKHMASDQHFLEHVCDQAGLGQALSWRKMFGEYALYLDARVVALVCGNQLFVKPTDAGRQLLGMVLERPAYPGEKPWFLMADELDNRALLRQLFLATAAALPLPKPRKPRVHKPRPPSA
jgi:TfoX/Sxy family transcriptional regulator of competence genes